MLRCQGNHGIHIDCRIVAVEDRSAPDIEMRVSVRSHEIAQRIGRHDLLKADDIGAHLVERRCDPGILRRPLRIGICRLRLAFVPENAGNGIMKEIEGCEFRHAFPSEITPPRMLPWI